MLIAKGAPLMERDNGGDGPMHWAAKRGDMSIMCTMKSAGACPKFPGSQYVCTLEKVGKQITKLSPN